MAHSSDYAQNIIKEMNLMLPKEGLNLNQALQHLQEAILLRALKETNGNFSQAAKLCGLKRSTFYNMVSKMDYKRPPKDYL